MSLKQKSTILCCIAAIGVIGTTVAAVEATPKAIKLLEEVKDVNGGFNMADVVFTIAPVYIPAAVIGFGTVCCIFGANMINRKQQASLTSAYALLDSYFRTYRGKLIELYGKEADIKIQKAMAREHCSYHVVDTDEPDEKVIFYEEISGESIMRYERDIMDAEYHFNRNFTMRGYAFLNELYEFLGLPSTEYGKKAGWSMSSGIMWVDFEHRLIDNDDGGPACYSIDLVFEPDILEDCGY